MLCKATCSVFKWPQEGSVTMEMYETLGIMGEGSYGRVLKCRQRATGRLVAVKKFIDSDHDPGVRRTAQREIHILRVLYL
ncbi:unnamed protein product [Arctogadus glacialis]